MDAESADLEQIVKACDCSEIDEYFLAYYGPPWNFDSPFDTLYSNMLKNGVRHCDICERAITSGERYFVRAVERDQIPPNADIPRSGLAVDALGNVRVDVCRECRTGMHLSGGEEVMA